MKTKLTPAFAALRRGRQELIAAAFVGVLASVAATARAADTAATPAATSTTAAAAVPESLAPAAVADTDPWQFGLTVPFWAPQVDGNVTVLGHQKDVKIPFSDLKDHLDASFALALNAQKGKFGLFGNAGYMKFSGGFNDQPGGNFSAVLKFVVANAGVSYLLFKTESEHPFVLVGTAGVRYWFASTDIDHHDVLGNRDWHGYEKWNLFDPVIGLRASQYLTRKLHLDVAGDGGGFNLNHNTDWTWSAVGMLSYDFCKYFTASAGYQAVALDESAGDKGINLIFNGVAANLTFKF